MSLDRATTWFLGQLAKSDDAARHPRTVDDLRSLARTLADSNGPGPAMESVREVTLRASGEPTAQLRVLTSRPRVPGVVVYFPGPAWGCVAGTLDTTDTVCRKLAERTGCTFVVADCRKAPEHPYPAAVQDAWQAVLWAEQYRSELPHPTPPLVVLGNGAGGALGAVVSRRSQDGPGRLIGLSILVSPFLDAPSESTQEESETGLLTAELAKDLWQIYLPNVADRSHPEAAPGRADFDSTHPPTILLTPEHDPLRQSAERYLDRLAAAGVETDRQVFAGQMHGFFDILALPQGERAFQTVIRRVRRYVTDRVALETR